MKKLSLSAIAIIATTSTTMAEIDLKTSGQAAFYAQTLDSKGTHDLFESGRTSRATAGLQVNVNGDLGNDFDLGLQGIVLGTLGLENNIVGASMQSARTDELNGAQMSKIFISKKINNTIVKLGRQELPKALSPFAFSEKWNVFSNTFDAALVVNQDIVDTTIVAAYVANGNGHLDLAAPALVDLGTYHRIGESGAYMLTVANKSLKEFQPTVSYYQLPNTGKKIIWGDAKVDANLPVKLSLQGGKVMTSGADTSAYGAKLTTKLEPTTLTLAYSHVGDGGNGITNAGTGVKTPLYTQLIFNQTSIDKDNDTVMLSAVVPLTVGKIIIRDADTKSNDASRPNYNEFDLIYKFPVLGTQMFASYMREKTAGFDANNVLRFWSRYNF